MSGLDAFADAYQPAFPYRRENLGIALAFGADKLRLSNALGDAGPPAIPTRLVAADVGYDELAQALGCPFIIKPRRGSASKGFAIVSGPSDWGGISRDGSLIAQVLVGTADEEYTAGVYGDGRGSCAATIVMRRWLGREGNTVRAEVVSADPFRAAIETLCQLGQPVGPTNFQFRLDRGTAYLLEINPRFSSTTYMRTLCGYNEAAMAFDHYVGGVLPEQPNVQSRRLIRYAEDRIW